MYKQSSNKNTAEKNDMLFHKLLHIAKMHDVYL